MGCISRRDFIKGAEAMLCLFHVPIVTVTQTLMGGGKSQVYALPFTFPNSTKGTMIIYPQSQIEWNKCGVYAPYIPFCITEGKG